MSTCAEIRESIGVWLDGELSGAGADAVRLHLQECPACGEERRQLEKLNVAMKGVFESGEFGPDAAPFWQDLQRRIGARRPWHAELIDWAGPLFRAPAFAWVVPAVIVILIGVLYFDPIFSGWSVRAPRNSFAAVESIDTYGRSVALLRENETKTTVIWLYQNPYGESEASGETVDKSPAF
jgi:hypothetical protein